MLTAKLFSEQTAIILIKHLYITYKIYGKRMDQINEAIGSLNIFVYRYNLFHRLNDYDVSALCVSLGF